MILFKKINDLQKYLSAGQEINSTIGFVPTMGALHAGHISLIARSKEENPVTVCSIFVNPTQFNDPGDFEKYPITIDKDIYLLEKANCDVLFLPDVQEIYPQKNAPDQNYDLGELERILEGKYRPGHFQGVCQVVDRLLNIVRPNNLYIGQKDYQQCMVIERLVHIMGMQEKISIHKCPTLREPDGLAMSSRNARLDAEERKKATTIFKTLCFIKENIKKGTTADILQEATNMLLNNGFKVDYVSIANSHNLHPITEWDGKEKIVALIAAFYNEVRLIDNMLLN